jgi:HAMP domain-containing protein
MRRASGLSRFWLVVVQSQGSVSMEEIFAPSYRGAERSWRGSQLMKPQNSATAGARRRGPLARLRDVRIRTKLGLILIVPIVALTGLAAVQLVGTSQDVMQGRDAIQYAKLADRAASLGEYLQSERTSAAVLLTASKQDQPAALSTYNDRAAKTDRQTDAYRRTREQIGKPAANLTDLLKRIDNQVGALEGLRAAVIERTAIPLSTAVFTYRSLIANLLAYRETLANVAGSVDAANLARGANAAAAYTELTSQEQETGTVMLTAGDLTQAQHESLLAILASKSEALRTFGNAVDAADVSYLQRILAGKGVGKDAPIKLDDSLGGVGTNQVQDDARVAQRFEGDLNRAPAGQPVTLSGGASPAQWTRAMATEVALSRQVERRIDGEFRVLIQDQENQLLQQLIVESLVVSLLVLIAIAIALLTARSMARSLQRLREGALLVAYQNLPESVARLRNPTTLAALTPDDVVAGVRDVVPTTGRDEIGQVSEAFNVVYREAVRIAAEQAALRGGVSTMFTNLARRSQLMVDRLIGRLDKVERGEEDPDRLGQLFELDHLATQMRRNDENLLVLAGVETNRRRRESAPLGDVLRAAQSQVDQYTRIELGSVDMEVRVVGPAVNDLVHLIAELLDNATTFSAPDTLVTAEATWIGGRAFVTISDHGVGIAPEQLAELNQRLADPPPVDVALSRTMGLVVVGRLAERLGATVELRAPANYSTMAEVAIPSSILEVRQRALAVVEAPPRVRGVMAPARLDMATRWPAARFDRRPAARPPTPPPAPPAPPAGPPPPASPPLPARSEPYQAQRPQPPGALDDTADIPLFREVNSAWFRDGPEPASGPARPSGNGGWGTAADSGWQVASSVRERENPEIPRTGLPRREPMAQLVPGGVETPAAVARPARSPDAVRGLLSAYQRGVQRARTGDAVLPPARPDDDSPR